MSRGPWKNKRGPGRPPKDEVLQTAQPEQGKKRGPKPGSKRRGRPPAVERREPTARKTKDVNSDVAGMIAELEAKRDKIQQAIDALRELE